MGESQLAQIDCRKADCIFQEKGKCHNISPAISLNPGRTAICWSHQTEIEEDEA